MTSPEAKLSVQEAFEQWTANGGTPLLHVFSLTRHPNKPRYLEGTTELCLLAFQAGARFQAAQPVSDGWVEAVIAWEVCASIHEKYAKGKDAKGKDALFTTRRKDFLGHAENARKHLPAHSQATQSGQQDA